MFKIILVVTLSSFIAFNLGCSSVALNKKKPTVKQWQ